MSPDGRSRRVTRSRAGSRSAHKRPEQRRGTVLIIVLVVVVLLTLGAYTFTEFMVLEAKSSALHGQAVRARAMADSGVELIAAQLEDRLNVDPIAIYDNPQLFRAASIREGTGGVGRFTVIAPVENDESGLAVRYGLIDESGRLNVNTLLKLKLDEEQARNMFMFLPYATEELADAILDFVDEDDDAREYGAESDVYASYGYAPKNGPLDTLDELLLVDGMTPELLFGEDANRNGILDPNENDGPATLPYDNADGRLDRGWSAYLTVHSRERNIQADGSDRINVNNNILTDLKDQLLEVFTEDEAKFIIAYRLFGPVADETSPMAGTTNPQAAVAGALSGQQGQQAASQAALGLARGLAAANAQGMVTIFGMNATAGGSFTFTSIYDLVDSRVQATIDGASQTLESPWTIDEMPAYLPELLDKLTLVDGQFIEGRVNINQAPVEVISGLPGMTEELAASIASAQQSASSSDAGGDVSGRATTGWLVIEQLVDLPTMRKLDPYITARGDVYRAQVIGFFDKGGPISRLEAVIDASTETAQILAVRDLTDLGRGYSATLLGGSQ